MPNEVEFENLVEQSKNGSKFSFKLIAVNFINDTSGKSKTKPALTMTDEVCFLKDFKQLNYKINQIMSSNLTQSVLLNLKFNSPDSTYNSSLFTETILNEMRDLNAHEEKSENCKLNRSALNFRSWIVCLG